MICTGLGAESEGSLPGLPSRCRARPAAGISRGAIGEKNRRQVGAGSKIGMVSFRTDGCKRVRCNAVGYWYGGRDRIGKGGEGVARQTKVRAAEEIWRTRGGRVMVSREEE